MIKLTLHCCLPLSVLVLSVAAARGAVSNQFARDVQPILARKCFACHGPDAESREADLRLDNREAAIAAGVIDLDHPGESSLLERILSPDEDLRMPPPESGKVLSDVERRVLEQWIRGGAKYQTHWAFSSPIKPPVPRLPDTRWLRNEIDAFVLARMRDQGLSPAPEADRYTLVRRLYLDLTGLPPSPEDVDRFAGDSSPLAFDRLVSELLSAKHYGERWAQPWLDAARYADTNGYEKDRARSIWPYRDWVIKALNEDLPFDQFTIEQIAGDMLPNATLEQRIATGFHRNTMLNEEGGIDPLEYRFYALVDRVATTGAVWMGLTIGCAQCHAHKYDPISHEDFYRCMALLNNADEPDIAVDAKSAAEIDRIHAQIARLERRLRGQFPLPGDDSAGKAAKRRRREAFERTFESWCEQQRLRAVHWTVATPSAFRSNLPKLERLSDDSLFASGDFTKRDEFFIQLRVSNRNPITALRLEVLPDERLPAGGPGRAYYEGRKGDFFLSELTLRSEGHPVKFKAGSVSYGKIAVGSGNAIAENVFDNEGSTGWSTAGREGRRHTLVLNLDEPTVGDQLDVRMLFERHFVAALGRFRFSVTSDPGAVQATELAPQVEQVLCRDPETWSESERQIAVNAFLRSTPALAEARKPIDQLRASLRPSVYTLVMQERPEDNPRKTYVHHRGEWLGQRAEVSGAVPAVLDQLPDSAAPNRLTFARWLASPHNPLVARVVVNRAWAQLMGHAIVRSDGDFGTQSEPPTHPDLLDWLAVEFMEQGWSMKWLHRKIVSSATYRQSSNLTPRQLTQDPTNHFFARGPRHRLDAETIRDVMLCASGLLSERVGGPSVHPPQPQSVTALAYGGTKWNPSQGENRYRRSLYTFKKRTAPFAAFTTFDAPSGENCTVTRSRSNTPLQALTLLNDEMYLEFSRALGCGAAKQTDLNDEQRMEWMFRRLLSRPPRTEEMSMLVDYYRQQLERCAAQELVPANIVGRPDATSRMAGMVMLARVLMNLNETITKR